MTPADAIDFIVQGFFWSLGLWVVPFIICICLRYGKQIGQAAT